MDQDKNNNPQGAPDGAQNAPQQERTFTQAQVDAIVAERLGREKAKFADYDTLKEKADKYDAAEEANKSDLQKAQDAAAKAQQELADLKAANTAREMRAKVAKETGVPESLLSGDDETACRAQAQAIQDYAKGTGVGFPNPKDGGEVKKPAAGGTTRDQFADWFNNNT